MAPPAPSPALIAAQARTLERLASIQNHFNTAKGTGRLAGKVAILTGVGSTKGIGCASLVH